jgi:hypothetical protein
MLVECPSKQLESILDNIWICLLTNRTLKADPNSIFPLLLSDERAKLEELLKDSAAADAKARMATIEKKLTKISKDDDTGKYLFDRGTSLRSYYVYNSNT